MPTSEDMVRFIAALPHHLKGRGADCKPALSVIKNAQMHLDRALAFHYECFKLSRTGALRIEATIQHLLNDGKITRDLVPEAMAYVPDDQEGTT